MLKTRFVLICSLMFIAILSASAAQAAYDIERQVTIRDAHGGEYIATSTGQIRIPGRDTRTSAQFTDFHLDDVEWLVNGHIERRLVRDVDGLMLSFDGDIEVVKLDEDNRVVSIRFEGLSLVHDGIERQFTGNVVLDGKTIQAEAMPRQAARILRRVLRLLKP